MILEGETCVGCEYCSSFIIHPIDGYQAGCSNHSPHSSRSISDHNKDPLMGFDTELDIFFDSESYLDDLARYRSPQPNSPGWLNQTIRCGNLGVDHYNKENNTKFELVMDENTMDSNSFIGFDGVVVHSIFNAVEDSSVQQFFAEVGWDHSSNNFVVLCKMLKEGQTRMGCYFCTNFIHPVDGLKDGCIKDVTNASSSVSDSDRDTLMDPNHNILFEKVKDSNKITATSPTHQQQE